MRWWRCRRAEYGYAFYRGRRVFRADQRLFRHRHRQLQRLTRSGPTTPPGAAALLFGGQPQTGSISSAAQSNSYTFSGSANDVVNFTIVGTSGNLSPRIKLFNAVGALVTQGYSNSPGGCGGGATVELNNIKLPATGIYALLVSDCFDTNTGNYNVSSQCLGVCSSGQPVSSSFSVSPAGLSFTYQQGDANLPSAQGLGVFSSPSGTGFTASATSQLLGTRASPPPGKNLAYPANAVCQTAGH